MILFLILERSQNFNYLTFNQCILGKWKLTGSGRKQRYQIEIKESSSKLRIHFRNSNNHGDIFLKYNEKNQTFIVFYKSKQIATTSFGLEPKCSFYTKSFEPYQNYSFIFDYAYEKGKFYFSNQNNEEYITYNFKRDITFSFHSFLKQFFFGVVCIYITFKFSLLMNQKDKSKGFSFEEFSKILFHLDNQSTKNS